MGETFEIKRRNHKAKKTGVHFVERRLFLHEPGYRQVTRSRPDHRNSVAGGGGGK
jgi:hypothetical protein